MELGKKRFCSFRCYRSFVGESSIETKTRVLLERHKIYFEQEFAVSKTKVFDFYIPSKNLLIECDGDYWHSRQIAIDRDRKKNEFAKHRGYNLVRFSESTINSPEFPNLLLSQIEM